MLRVYTQVVKTCFHRCWYLNFIRNLAVVKQPSQPRSENINKNDSQLPAAQPKTLPPAERAPEPSAGAAHSTGSAAVTLPRQLPSAASRSGMLGCMDARPSPSSEDVPEEDRTLRAGGTAGHLGMQRRTDAVKRGAARGTEGGCRAGRAQVSLGLERSGRPSTARKAVPGLGAESAPSRPRAAGRRRAAPRMPVPRAPRGRAGPASCACHSLGGGGEAPSRRRRFLRERVGGAGPGGHRAARLPPGVPAEARRGGAAERGRGRGARSGRWRPAGGGHVYRRGGAAVHGPRRGRRGRGGGVALRRYAHPRTPSPAPFPQPGAGPALPRRPEGCGQG